ncbi:hypothetical protein N7468_000920 [Penicillium chermesinum]|uniref:Uncharacterized protein n=1 Tax=Penicillium chermesinum TaxID=63820 RepID=A0A9W9PIM3_9EURO|nr:uncharacterized protein N7468_000920 [Penicillium chermesinum]KAJ5245937.1 hypothetical protein N7468_000920 [Penicillium chermesinum]
MRPMPRRTWTNPPDHQHIFHDTSIHQHESIEFVRPPMICRQESLLTRALKNSPEMSPTDQHHSIYDSTYNYRSYPHSNISGISTAELTSDGGMTSPSLSNTPSPPLPPQMLSKPSVTGKKEMAPRVKVVDTSETAVEANLGRKRCISFACGRKAEPPKPAEPAPQATPETPIEPPKRKSALTFVCPGRQSPAPAPTSALQRERSPAHRAAFRSRCRGSPAPVGRKGSPAPARKISAESAGPSRAKPAEKAEKVEKTSITLPKGVPTSGLGLFEESEATRFHEFASSTDEDEEWVKKTTEYPEKITMNDCMKKENAIRRLAEEVDAEALDEDEEDDDVEDIADDDSTIHDFSSDDGNESDNEAGFADSDDSDDDGSDYEFWAPSITVSDGSNAQPIDVTPPVLERRASNTGTSFDSLTDDHQKWLPAPVRRMAIRRSASKPIKMRPGTPKLPDSTDFVCGTLDEDRPLEVAYKSCIEQRRLQRRVVIPQDIDPSFPTSDPEDNGDLEDISQDQDDDEPALDSARGRTDAPVRKASPRHSPKRIMSPPPPSRRAGRSSPKRLKSPPPRARGLRAKSPSPSKRALPDEMPHMDSPRGLNISHLVQQRQTVTRTKSLPRKPNPFFASDQSYRSVRMPSFQESHEREPSRTRELHTRGPIDIVEGLEKKRQKRKEKFWRQHCRKNAKEQIGRRPIPGKGAERMKELGLEVAERTRAYGVGQDTQLVLSV